MKVLIKHEEIVGFCKSIGQELTAKFKNSNPVVVCILKGACPFCCELVKCMDMLLEMDYMQISSYCGECSSGEIKIKKDLEIDIRGRDVIVVEDIVDTGLTLSKLKEVLRSRGVKSLTFVSMLDKPSRRKVEFKPDYIGKTIDDYFVVGFGLDFNEKYRNLKDICVYNED